MFRHRGVIFNRGLIFKRIPDGIPVVGRDLTVESREFDIEQEPPKGGLITKNLYGSLNHYQRLLMGHEDLPLCYARYKIDEPITNISIAKVLKSNNSSFTEGKLIRGMLPIKEYSVISKKSAEDFDIIENPQELDIEIFLGALGLPGIIAYSSFYELGKPSAGETIFVSSATGPVGQLIGQFAIKEKLHVFGSVGTNDRLDYILEKLKFDGGFNFNEENPSDAITRLIPQGIDIYYENGSGEQLDAVLDVMKIGGRIITAGMISEYCKPQSERYVMKNMMRIVSKEITIQGCLLWNARSSTRDCARIRDNISRMIKDRKLDYKTFTTKGIENAGSAFVEMLVDQNFGNAVLQILIEEPMANNIH